MKNALLLVGILLMFSCGSTPKQSSGLFTAPSSGKAGSKITVTYTSPMSSKVKDRAWVTIVGKTKSDKTWGKWKYVEDNAASTELTCPKVAGEYEIRLHTGYPKKSYNVVARQDFTVK